MLHTTAAAALGAAHWHLCQRTTVRGAALPCQPTPDCSTQSLSLGQGLGRLQGKARPHHGAVQPNAFACLRGTHRETEAKPGLLGPRGPCWKVPVLQDLAGCHGARPSGTLVSATPPAPTLPERTFQRQHREGPSPGARASVLGAVAWPSC